MDLSSPGHVDLFNIFFHLLGKELLSELSAKKQTFHRKSEMSVNRGRMGRS